MLGEKIGGAEGKVTSQRVLPNPGGGPKMETSFQSKGTLLGTNITETGTYWAIVRPDGTLYGEGQGVVMAKDGKMATWDRTRRGHDEERRHSELSRRRLLSKLLPKMVPAEQDRSDLRIRGRSAG